MTQDKIDGLFKKVERCSNNLISLVTALGKAMLCLWVPLTTALISLILFSSVDQTLEIYRAFAQDEAKGKIFLSSFFMFWLSFFVWYSGRLLAFKSESSFEQWVTCQDKWTFLKSKIKNGTFAKEDFENIALEWLPRIFGLLPLVGLGIGIYKTIEIAPKLKNLLFLWCGVCAITILILFLITIFRRGLPVLGSSNDEGLFGDNAENILANLIFVFFASFTLPLVSYLSSASSLGVISVFILCVILFLLLLLWNPEKKPFLFVLFIFSLALSVIFLWLPISPVLVLDYLGAISITALALTFITVAFSTIYNWGRRFSQKEYSRNNKIPAVFILIVLALVLSAFNINDNHQIRHFERLDDTDYIQSLSLKQSFEDWLGHRRDLDKFKLASSEANSKEYPVYVVSAEGGGIFAAYHAAITLSRLNDTISEFSEHVFAISGVSGGSLGATIYSSLVKENIDARQGVNKIEDKAHNLLERDFLSPILAMAFYPDFVQRFLPFSINDWDRARGLEVGLEESWNLTQDAPNPLQQAYSEFWDPRDFAPALVLNTTIVETGERLLFSPFKFKTRAIIFDFKNANFDIPLSTTAVLSARFPLVTPVGWVSAGINNGKDKFRLADGGYFDNSGVVTALDITRALNEDGFLSKLEKKYGIKIKIVNLAIVDTVDENPGISRSQGLNELLSPVRALLNVRETREETTIQRAASSLNRGISDPFSYRFRKFLLDTKKAHLPLGWLLSKTSQDKIDEQIGSFHECDEKEFQEFYVRNLNVSNHNSCVAESIKKDLSVATPLNRLFSEKITYSPDDAKFRIASRK